MLFVLQRILLSPVLCSHSWLAIMITLCFCLAYLPSVFPASAAHCWQSVSMNSSATIAQGYICTATIAQVRGITESCRLGLRLMRLIHFILSKSINVTISGGSLATMMSAFQWILVLLYIWSKNSFPYSIPPFQTTLEKYFSLVGILTEPHCTRSFQAYAMYAWPPEVQNMRLLKGKLQLNLLNLYKQLAWCDTQK